MQKSILGITLMVIGGFLFVAAVLVGSISAAPLTEEINPYLLHGTPNPQATPQVSSESSTISDPTYYADIEPIIQQNCAACHTEGGIGYSVYDVNDLALIADPENAAYIADVTGIRYMPPWPPSNNSLPMQHERKLTDEEIALIARWVETGAPMGDEADRQPPAPQDNIPQIAHDVVLTMPEPYTPTGELLDDYRCFVLDPGFETDTLITGTDFIPGNAEIAHHALFFVISDAMVEEAEARSGTDGRPGWQCFGGTGLTSASQPGAGNIDPTQFVAALRNQGVDFMAVQGKIAEYRQANPNTQPDLTILQAILSDLNVDIRQLVVDLDIDIASMSGTGMDSSVGGWVPGSVPVVSPENTGILVPAGSQIVLQMHYNLYNTIGSDQSSLIFDTAPFTEDMTPIRARALVAPVEIPCPVGVDDASCDREISRQSVVNPNTGNLLLAACGQSLATYADNTADNAYGYCDYPINFEGWILGVGPHMHELGKSSQVVLNPDTPEETLLIEIPEWDFHWQGQYSFAQPVALKPGDTVRLECWWDNSDGERYVVWGEGTQDEMCFNFTRFLVKEPGKTLADYGFTEAADPQTAMPHDHSTDEHTHDGLIEIGHDAPIPSVSLTVTPAEDGGYLVQLAVENFTFAPEAVDGPHVEGEGHAHLYVNGEKITRLFETEYYLESLPAGLVTISVTLNTNNHMTYSHHGEIIGDAVIVNIE